jgi:hypothetical protein
MSADCVLAAPRIAQVDPGDEPLPEVVLSQTSRDTATVSKMGPMIVMGLPKLRGLSQNPPAGSAQPRAKRVRDKVTQRVASS